jgi:hypothetical protein
VRASAWESEAGMHEVEAGKEGRGLESSYGLVEEGEVWGRGRGVVGRNDVGSGVEVPGWRG